jgi:spermidine synthase
VIEGDGADHVQALGAAGDKPDVIMMDAFDRHGLSGSVSSVGFYWSVHNALSGRGIMVANLAGDKADRGEHMAMIGEAFDERVLSLSLPDGNDIVLAFKNPAFAPAGARSPTRPRRCGPAPGWISPSLPSASSAIRGCVTCRAAPCKP